jgi:hypothetical protein
MLGVSPAQIEIHEANGLDARESGDRFGDCNCKETRKLSVNSGVNDEIELHTQSNPSGSSANEG